MKIDIGIIGGSGLCQFPELNVIKRIKLHTKYGWPSDEIVIGAYRDKKVAFLPGMEGNILFRLIRSL